jgi:hypothetical protein
VSHAFVNLVDFRSQIGAIRYYFLRLVEVSWRCECGYIDWVGIFGRRDIGSNRLALHSVYLTHFTNG